MPKVSVFKGIKNVTNPENIDLITCLENTRDGRWEDEVTQCRLIKDKKERDEFKDTMQRIVFSGKFSRRRDDSLEEHSGVICIDLDYVEDMENAVEALKRDRYVFAVFMSTSGQGLRVLFKIDPTKFKQSYHGIAKYLYDHYKLPCDPQSQVLSKPYCVTFDPDLYLNEKAVIFKNYVKETPIKEIVNFVHTPEDFESVLDQIKKRNVSIAEDYTDWIKVGMAICDQFGEGGRQFFHDISRPSTRYNAKDTNTHYNYFLKRNHGNKANIATFYYFAKLSNISITTERTKVILRATKNGKKAGLDKETIVNNLEKFENITGVNHIVDEVFDKDINEPDDQENMLYQLELFLNHNYSLRMNEVTGYLEQGGRQLTQSDLNTIFVAAKKLIPKLDYPLMIRVLKSDFTPLFNPFFEFFGSDGIAVELPPMAEDEEKSFDSPLIDKLAQTIVNENPAYTLFFIRKWIVSIISSAHKVHSPLLLCLLGGQNTGKTEWFRRLLPKELQSYYAESKLDKEKDDELLMTENLIIMDDELGGKSKQDNLKLKNITSKQWFSLRRPYGDHNEKILRLAVLCGTSNQRQILSDPTGNRRIIPIEVGDINKHLYNTIDKKELFMEAFRLYKQGFDWRINPKDVEYLNKDQENYEMVVAEKELLQKFYSNEDEQRMSSTEIKVEIEMLTNQRLNLNVIGRELESLGFVRKTTREGAKTIKKWCVKKINRNLQAPLVATDNPF